MPAGYMAKRDLKDVYSVSSCVNENFADYIEYWQHNGFATSTQSSSVARGFSTTRFTASNSTEGDGRRLLR
jgi:hypothetical protein